MSLRRKRRQSDEIIRTNGGEDLSKVRTRSLLSEKVVGDDEIEKGASADEVKDHVDLFVKVLVDHVVHLDNIGMVQKPGDGDLPLNKLLLLLIHFNFFERKLW